MMWLLRDRMLKKRVHAGVYTRDRWEDVPVLICHAVDSKSKKDASSRVTFEMRTRALKQEMEGDKPVVRLGAGRPFIMSSPSSTILSSPPLPSNCVSLCASTISCV
jgi:hypothetical protein